MKNLALNLRVSRETKDRLVNLSGDSTLSDTVRRALVLYEQYTRTVSEGGVMVIQSADGTQTQVEFL